MEMIPNGKADITFERNIWANFILNKLITKPSNCPLSSYLSTNFNEYNSLNNPYIASCSINKCQKILFLGEGTIFSHFPRTPTSHILYIIKLRLIQIDKATEIYNRYRNGFLL